MEIGHLLDTDTCIYLIKDGGRRAGILGHLDRLEMGAVGVSSVTVAELWTGVEKSKYRRLNSQALEKFLLDLVVLPFNDRAARAYGTVRAALERKGRGIGPLDTLIAAHAVSLKATLITNNIREFHRVPGLKVRAWAGLP